MRTDERDLDSKRRNVLKAVGASVGAVGLSGQAAARRSSRAEENADEESFVALIEQADAAVSGLLENLSAEGYIDSPTIDALGFEEVVASRDVSQNALSVHTATFDGEEFLVYETLLPTDQFDSDINVTIVPERGKAGATAVRNDERYVLSAGYETFTHASSDLGTLSECSDCTCGVYCTQAYDDAKFCEDEYGEYKECCMCSNW